MKLSFKCYGVWTVVRIFVKFWSRFLFMFLCMCVLYSTLLSEIKIFLKNFTVMMTIKGFKFVFTSTDVIGDASILITFEMYVAAFLCLVAANLQKILDSSDMKNLIFALVRCYINIYLFFGWPLPLIFEFLLRFILLILCVYFINEFLTYIFFLTVELIIYIYYLYKRTAFKIYLFLLVVLI